MIRSDSSGNPKKHLSLKPAVGRMLLLSLAFASVYFDHETSISSIWSLILFENYDLINTSHS